MAYTANSAIDDFKNFMPNSNFEEIENTKGRGLLLIDDLENKSVIFIYPLVHKEDNTKNYFDTRDSGVKERYYSWKYALENGLKYFIFGINNSVLKYQNYVFSLECSEQQICTISGTKDGMRNGPGNQIIIPNSYEPQKSFDRISNRLGVSIAVIGKQNINNYITMFDNRPFMEIITDTDGYSEENMNPVIFNTELETEFAHNRIIFGAPGTGKSYTLNKESIGDSEDPDSNYLLKNGGEYERVTFHPDYSYANFVGTYKPTMLDNGRLDLSDEQKQILDILRDKTLTGQGKYDKLWDICDNREPKFSGLSAIPTLLRLFDPEAEFQAKKPDGSNNERNNDYYGNEIRPYVTLLSEVSPEASEISYEYIPGPFMRVYVKALKNARTDNPKPHLLLIEEINRANVAAVFGDIFQLLDRDTNNVSEYPIQASEDVKKYLAKELGENKEDCSEILIPNNMFIWASMNSADQGVFPMDTAFKRRWSFTYQGINQGDEDIHEAVVKLGNSPIEVNWNELRKAINAELISYNVNEDKLLGAHFVSKSSLENKEKFDETFKSKVIMYLFDDAAKQKRQSMFAGVEVLQKSPKLYSDICEAYDSDGIGIFSLEIQRKFSGNSSKSSENESEEF